MGCDMILSDPTIVLVGHEEEMLRYNLPLTLTYSSTRVTAGGFGSILGPGIVWDTSS